MKTASRDISMTPNSPQAAEVKASIDELIQSAASGDAGILDRIYHNDMHIYMFDETGALHQHDKASFSAFIESVINSNAPPNTWADYHLVEANNQRGHVLISRKNNLNGAEQRITLSIDLIFSDGRWQIIREVIFPTP